jgi:hypothetical protein
MSDEETVELAIAKLRENRDAEVPEEVEAAMIEHARHDVRNAHAMLLIMYLTNENMVDALLSVLVPAVSNIHHARDRRDYSMFDQAAIRLARAVLGTSHLEES